MRIRSKECSDCGVVKDALYRCRYGDQTAWWFLCGSCLTRIKASFADTYQYGGTWKRRKK